MTFRYASSDTDLAPNTGPWAAIQQAVLGCNPCPIRLSSCGAAWACHKVGAGEVSSGFHGSACIRILLHTDHFRSFLILFWRDCVEVLRSSTGSRNIGSPGPCRRARAQFGPSPHFRRTITGRRRALDSAFELQTPRHKSMLEPALSWWAWLLFGFEIRKPYHDS